MVVGNLSSRQALIHLSVFFYLKINSSIRIKVVIDEMNERQRKFADEYIKSGNATQSAISAGYSNKYANTNANKLLQNTTVKAYIDERMDLLKKDAIADQDEILQYLTSVMRGEVTDQEAMPLATKEGQQIAIAEKRSDTTARTKAAELLGKRYVMWTDKTISENSGHITIVNDLSE